LTALLEVSEAQIARAGIGRKFQRPAVLKEQAVAENLTLALKAARSPWHMLMWRCLRPCANKAVPITPNRRR
jgi:urea transport system ATP-binding protein